VTQDLGADRSLSGNDERIVEWMNERHPAFGRKRVAVCLGIAIGVAGEHHLRTHRTHCIHLDPRRCLRHDDHGPEPQLARGVGDTL
jgi:hypothetical protein